ncbi:MAG: hypothetical protein JST26_07755 [Bacteroidetes bacterium]|nr:hypothetical protein [Bacteroidota bacterium]
MKIQCKNCLPKEGIEVPDFNEPEKQKLSELKIQSPILAMKYIVDYYKLSQRDAKYITTHINKIHDRCNRCAYDKLGGEYVECPRCGSLNFNWQTDAKTLHTR